MPEIKIDPWKNRLYITLKDWHQADMPKYVEQVETACNELLPGFTCMTVFQNGRVIRARDENLFLDTADLISAYGASCVVWVNKNASRARLISNPPKQTRIPVEVAPDIKLGESILDRQTDYTVAHEMDYLIFRALNPKSKAQLPCHI